MEFAAKGQPPIDTTNYYWRWMFLISLLFGLIWYGLSSAIDIAEISRNWPKYRCNPTVMPFASLYGYDTNENFNYCLTQMFSEQAGQTTGPFASILSVMIKNSMSFLSSLNNLRMMLATLLGGISKIVQEFVDRFKLLFNQIKITGLRMQMLFKRVFAIMYSVIFMAMSGITAGMNFGDTFIFKFLDTFCFAPETQIDIEGKGTIPISQVQLGDICSKNGAKVVSTYRFKADGQDMVFLNGIEVSSNHYVRYEGKWIPSINHPDAVYVGRWNGGESRPLICLDTDTHEIPLGNYIFSDWDETSESDTATMELAEKRLNGGHFMDAPRSWLYQPAMSPTTNLYKRDSTQVLAKDVQLHDMLPTGHVVGIGRRHVFQYIELPNGEKVTPSTLLWKEHAWRRAGHLYPERIVQSEVPVEMVTFVIFKTACIQTVDGMIMRDMCEIHSPDMEGPTARALDPTSA